MGLFQLGDFTLHSGGKGKWKIDCDVLTPGDWECLAVMISQLVGPFGTVYGVPKGGTKLAKTLKLLVTKGESKHLIVDDVLTTGKSMEQARKNYQRKHPLLPVVGVVIFARGECPCWVDALFQLPEELWAAGYEHWLEMET